SLLLRETLPTRTPSPSFPRGFETHFTAARGWGFKASSRLRPTARARARAALRADSHRVTPSRESRSDLSRRFDFERGLDAAVTDLCREVRVSSQALSKRARGGDPRPSRARERS